jgi:alpha-1,2-mannosyltransferase
MAATTLVRSGFGRLRAIHVVGAASLAVAVVAFVARLYPVLNGGGLRGIAGYDDGVYYSAADAVVAGKVPYRDFVLLHPPGLIYLLTPFALLGHAIGDANGWAVARVAMMAFGAVSAVLVVLIGRRFGPVAAIGGGMLYAVWPAALNGESSTYLECLPNTLLLLALLILGSRRRLAHPAYQLLAGAALGLGLSIKIWGVVPLLVVVGWQLVVAGRRRAATVLAGAAIAAVVVCGPTFVLAPAKMFELVVRDQLQRSGVHTSLLVRFADFTPAHRWLPHASTATTLLLVTLVTVAGLAAAVGAWRTPRARIFVLLLLAQGAVLCSSPPYFTHYGAFLAPSVALTAGVGAQRLSRLVARRAPTLRRPAVAAMAALVAVTAIPVLTIPRMNSFNETRVAAVLANRRCVVADAPGSLVLAGVLTRDLERGCPTRIDVSGVTYNADAVRGKGGLLVSRIDNPVWQRDITQYLLSGQAAILSRSAADGLTPHSRAELRTMKVLYRSHEVTVYGHR